MKPKVLVAVNPELRQEIFSTETIRELESFADVTYHPGPGDMTGSRLREVISGFDGLVTSWGSPRITPEILSEAKRLRIISHCAGSVRPYVCEEVFSRGICVTNASSAIAVSVAETTIGLIICSLRHLFEYDRHLRSLSRAKADLGPSHELAGRTVGIIGMGEVGRRVMGFLRAFSCRILVYDPYKSREQIEEAGGLSVTLDDLMSMSDVVSIHAPNIPKNRHMITRDLLARMRDGALLVNTARGELIDQDSLIKEVASGRILCALDVFEGDPREVARKLEGAPNVILTPHVAGNALETRRRQGKTVVEDMGLFFSGKAPRNVVTRAMMEWMA